MESGVDQRFWMTGNEELDLRDLIHVAGEHGKNGRGRFVVLALIKDINDDEDWNMGGF